MSQRSAYLAFLKESQGGLVQHPQLKPKAARH
jgi:hypothetical protein